MSTIQYKTTHLKYRPSSFRTQSSEVHIDASAAQMQWHCRAIACKELTQGPYTVTVLDEARTPEPVLSTLQAERSYQYTTTSHTHTSRHRYIQLYIHTCIHIRTVIYVSSSISPICIMYTNTGVDRIPCNTRSKTPFQWTETIWKKSQHDLN